MFGLDLLGTTSNSFKEIRCLFKYCLGHPLPLKFSVPFRIKKSRNTCYDGLTEMGKRVFLDVACFFRGEYRERVVEILKCYFFDARNLVDALVEKSFLTNTNYNYAEMHDLMQDMGRENCSSRVSFHWWRCAVCFGVRRTSFYHFI